MARVVVLGGNGFIGSHLVDGLVLDGHDVSAFGRFGDGRAAFDASGVEVIRGEFLNSADVARAVRGVDIVLHFISTTTPASAEGDASIDMRTNVIGTVALLEACVAAGVSRVIFASTGGAIYGPQGRDGYGELDRVEPVSPYAIGKLAIENYLHYFRAVHGLASTALRISNPYGSRQPIHRLQGFIPIAIDAILEDRPVTRFGDGSMVRDYVYINDLVRMILPVVASDAPRHPVYNLGSGVGHSVVEVLDALGRVTGRPVRAVEMPVPPTFVDRVVLDVARFTDEFGAVPATSLDEGIRRTLEDMKARRGR